MCKIVRRASPFTILSMLSNQGMHVMLNSPTLNEVCNCVMLMIVVGGV